MQIGCIVVRNLNILAFCYVLLKYVDKRFIRDLYEIYKSFI